MMITWKHNSTDYPHPWSYELKVDIFYHRLWGWQLFIAGLMTSGGKDHDGKRDIVYISHSNFAMLHICLSYFETIGKYYEGYTDPNPRNKESKKHFRIGVDHVFSDMKIPRAIAFPKGKQHELIDLLYERARNGLYHASMTGPGLILCQCVEAIRYDGMNLFINPQRFIRFLQDHLSWYREALLDTKSDVIRTNFVKRFDHDNPPVMTQVPTP